MCFRSIGLDYVFLSYSLTMKGLLVRIGGMIGLSIPAVVNPDRALLFKDRVSWSILFAILFTALRNLQIFGPTVSIKPGLFSHLHDAVGCGPSTCLELGISPLITAHVISQLLGASRYCSIDINSKEGRIALNIFRKSTALILTLLMTLLLLSCGYYGSDISFTSLTYWVIIVQNVASQMIVVLMDESIEKGYGIGNGLSLFITTSVTSSLLWALLSPKFVNVSTLGGEYESIILSPFHLIYSRSNKLGSLWSIFFRHGPPNWTNLFATIGTAVSVLFLSSHRVDLSIQSIKMRGKAGMYPIRLLDHYWFPVLAFLALSCNIYFTSRCLSMWFGESILTLFLGRWVNLYGSWSPSGGILQLFAPPNFTFTAIADFISIFTYPTFVILMTTIMSKYWIDFSGQSAKDISKLLKDQQLTIKGFRETSVASVLDRYVSPAATTCGLLLGVIISVSDVCGSIGSGVGVVVATLGLQKLIETVLREQESFNGML